MSRLRRDARAVGPALEAELDDADESGHTFVIRIWLEEAAAEGRPATWRGHVRHVLEDRPQHVESLDEIVAVLAGYLRRMGVDVHA